ncbi:hypothetical protein CR205_02160 [Alteribacter lacisalsi]|uniref:Uncharacterized protein n=1 Tax=Alteribacter lacisalsi TaxID=2045244 RepID=A0A2W0HIW3_9BACI|nr:hypothetical protein [Alteribacter lacisalsi]PYZ97425.1 hypothetical protein CR205_02160 [Alteribacter lacisalsi]
MLTSTKIFYGLLGTFLLGFILLALLETAALSADSPDEAFSQFAEDNMLFDDKKQVGGYEIHTVDDALFIPFEVEGRSGAAFFRDGIFGLRHDSSFMYQEDVFTVRKDQAGDTEIVHGPVPPEILEDVESVTVQGQEGRIVRLSDDAGMFTFLDNGTLAEEEGEPVQVRFYNSERELLYKK